MDQFEIYRDICGQMADLWLSMPKEEREFLLGEYPTLYRQMDRTVEIVSRHRMATAQERRKAS